MIWPGAPGQNIQMIQSEQSIVAEPIPSTNLKALIEIRGVEFTYSEPMGWFSAMVRVAR